MARRGAEAGRRDGQGHVPSPLAGCRGWSGEDQGRHGPHPSRHGGRSIGREDGSREGGGRHPQGGNRRAAAHRGPPEGRREAVADPRPGGSPRLGQVGQHEGDHAGRSRDRQGPAGRGGLRRVCQAHGPPKPIGAQRLGPCPAQRQPRRGPACRRPVRRRAGQLGQVRHLAHQPIPAHGAAGRRCWVRSWLPLQSRLPGGIKALHGRCWLGHAGWRCRRNRCHGRGLHRQRHRWRPLRRDGAGRQQPDLRPVAQLREGQQGPDRRPVDADPVLCGPHHLRPGRDPQHHGQLRCQRRAGRPGLHRSPRQPQRRRRWHLRDLLFGDHGQHPDHGRRQAHRRELEPGPRRHPRWRGGHPQGPAGGWRLHRQL